MTRRLPALFTLLLLLAAPLVAASCSSDTADKAKDAAESAKDDVKTDAAKVSARSTAEALRASLKGNDTADKEGIRSVTAIKEASKDLPGDPKTSKIEDSDGDGLDDDGKVQVDIGDESACLTLPETGEDTKVENGAC